MASTKTRLSKLFWQQQIEALEEYCQEKRWTVEYVTNDSPLANTAFPNEKRLVIQRDKKPEITFYYFLHEIGHLLLCQNQSGYEERYTAVFEHFDSNSQTHKISRIEEELDAWKIGLKLAKRLDLTVRRRRFEQIKSRCIMSYIMWAAERRVKRRISEAVIHTTTKDKVQQDDNGSDPNITINNVDFDPYKESADDTI